MSKSLFQKYFTICATIILFSITVLGMVLLLFAAQYFKRERQDLLSSIVQKAVDYTEDNYARNGYLYLDTAILSQLFDMLSASTEAELFLTDTNGKTQFCTEEMPCQHTTFTVEPAILSQLAEGVEYRETGKLGGMYQKPYYTVARPIQVGSNNKIIGYIFASAPADALNAFLFAILRMFFFSALMVIAFSFVVIYFATRVLSMPLKQMSAATRSFAKGDFTARIPVHSYDEVGELAIAFNHMADSLAELESMRRSFVANVSHELKTPMTSIGGFIDGILDGTIPEEKREHYLRIVSNEVKRLSRLIRSMLNIARIEAGEMKIVATEFNISDVIFQCLFSFEKQIEEKGIDIRGLENIDKCMVSADKDLIHQVVYNLIDNAVKFCPENGYILFMVEARANDTVISVRNSGEGISKEELPHVFDRFYKTDKSRGKDKNGVGLGLYIVRSIINLHGGEIMVGSVKGEYCEFFFTLPTARNTSSGKLRQNNHNKKYTQ